MKLQIAALLILMSLACSALAQNNCDSSQIFTNEQSNAVCFDTMGAVRFCASNNYPDHSDNYNQPQFDVTAGDYWYAMCAYPEEGTATTPLYETTETTAGCTWTYTFGVSINGIKYDPNSAVTWQNPNTNENNLDWHVEATSLENNIGQNMGTQNGGHLNPFGEYHYHGIPTAYFSTQLGITAGSHSPIVGYAADGFPMYYKYVYSDADDSSSAIVALSSGYTLKSGQRPGDGTSAPDGPYDGNYVEDYKYSNTELDECNGRYGVTPEYPYGTYYYVLTDNFPYIPRCFKGSEVDHTFRIGPGPSCPSSTAATECTPLSYGCMDPFALNYNASANVDTGGCEYESVGIRSVEPLKLGLHPNPSNGNTTISMEHLSTGPMILSVYNMQGQLIRREHLNAQSMSYTLDKMKAGTYIVTLSDREYTTQKRLIITGQM